MDWVINEHIEPFDLSAPLPDVFPVVEQHLHRVDDSLHGVEAVRHRLRGLLDVTDAESGGRDSLELHTLNVTIGEGFESDRVDGHSLDVEPFAGRLANLSVFSETLGIDLSGEWVSETDKTLAVCDFHSVLDFPDSLLGEGRSVAFVELRHSSELAASILHAKPNQSMLQVAKVDYAFPQRGKQLTARAAIEARAARLANFIMIIKASNNFYSNLISEWVFFGFLVSV